MLTKLRDCISYIRYLLLLIVFVPSWCFAQAPKTSFSNLNKANVNSLASTDSPYKFDLSGYLKLDYTSFDNIELEKDLSFPQVRQGKITVKSSYDSFVKLKLQLAYQPALNNDPDIELDDAYFEFIPNKNWRVKAGQFRPEQGLELAASSRNLSTLERSIVTRGFSLGRAPGLGLGYRNKDWTANLAWNDGDDENDKYKAITSRITLAPFREKQGVFHLGLNYMMQNWQEGNDRIKTHPENYFANDTIESVRIKVEKIAQTGIELAGRWKSTSFQSEWLMRQVESKIPATQSQATYDGFYVQLSHLISNGGQGYRRYKYGRFTRIRNDIDMPVWEGVVKYSNLDLFDNYTGSQNQIVTLGINYFIASKWRVSFQASQFTQSLPASNQETTGHSFVLRGQYAF